MKCNVAILDYNGKRKELSGIEHFSDTIRISKERSSLSG